MPSILLGLQIQRYRIQPQHLKEGRACEVDYNRDICKVCSREDSWDEGFIKEDFLEEVGPELK